MKRDQALVKELRELRKELEQTRKELREHGIYYPVYIPQPYYVPQIPSYPWFVPTGPTWTSGLTVNTSAATSAVLTS